MIGAALFDDLELPTNPVDKAVEFFGNITNITGNRAIKFVDDVAKMTDKAAKMVGHIAKEVDDMAETVGHTAKVFYDEVKDLEIGKIAAVVGHKAKFIGNVAWATGNAAGTISNAVKVVTTTNDPSEAFMAIGKAVTATQIVVNIAKVVVPAIVGTVGVEVLAATAIVGLAAVGGYYAYQYFWNKPSMQAKKKAVIKSRSHADMIAHDANRFHRQITHHHRQQQLNTSRKTDRTHQHSPYKINRREQ